MRNFLFLFIGIALLSSCSKECSETMLFGRLLSNSQASTSVTKTHSCNYTVTRTSEHEAVSKYYIMDMETKTKYSIVGSAGTLLRDMSPGHDVVAQGIICEGTIELQNIAYEVDYLANESF